MLSIKLMCSSRRNFLPPDFWLMTSRFEMESFITTVVEEEQKRHEALEEDESEAKDAITSTHQRHRFLSTIAPRLELLQNLPFFIPFDTRVQIFRAFVQLDKSRQQIGEDFFGFDYSKLHANIRRETVFEDAFEAFHTLGRRFKRPLSITFYNENGQEAGIDGGGLTKELITSLCRQAFDANYALFKETSNNLVYPNPDNYAKQQAQLQAFEFLGLVIGKCFYEGILIDIAFAPFFLLNWVGGYRTSINDLRDLDEELYQGLNNLKDYKGDVESDLSLNFTISDEDYGAVKSVELRIDGSNTPVTNLNRLEYIHEVARYRLETKIAPQVAAFLRGLSQMIESHWFSMFNQNELQTVIGGAPIPIDVVDLKRNTSLAGYQENDPIISNFWQVLNDYSDDNRRKLIKFVTSVSRPPLLGFRELKPSFALQRAGEDETRLPTASTCVNLLKLPPYSTKEILWQKLTYAINSEAGFDLS